VNNIFYGARFARVVLGTWWRERRRRGAKAAAAPSPLPSQPS
jgi:hypothetical protein